MLSFGSLFRVPIIPHGHRYHRNLSKTALTLTFLPWLVLPTPVSHAYSSRYTPKPAQPFKAWLVLSDVVDQQWCQSLQERFIPTCLSFALANASLCVGLAMPSPKEETENEAGRFVSHYKLKTIRVGHVPYTPVTFSGPSFNSSVSSSLVI